ncbi:hypothetical protein [Streptoalloteichus hindustanus]|uniref:Peptidoglycan/LPS O-acetylase OafA/YrhL, contains acyltransferase and SGNH-hydrolase domains n=1 Tax=Streptoalloteichus hindustanus TaxID=2017 RepID=A0A1M4V9Y1_STRHI|nr:hypothetical protein [Streptoalloteichus hindustanus]SHE65764.1 hypothetical protein SAMN05444320_101696 [Streptoalloteichus hindustanus]
MRARRHPVLARSGLLDSSLAPAGVLLLRALGTTLVVYSLLGLWLAEHAEPLWLVDTAREWLNRALGIGEDFGGFGLCLLLLTHGWDEAAAHARGECAKDRIRRLLGHWLPVVVATVVAIGALSFGADVLTRPDTVPQPDLLHALGAVTLADQVLPQAAPLLPLAWLVLVQIAGSLLASASRRTGRVVWLAPAAQLVAVSTVGVLGVSPGPTHRVAEIVAFLPLVVIGQVAYQVWAREISSYLGTSLGLLAWVVSAAISNTHATLRHWWYPVTFLFAVLLFLVTVRTSGRTADRVARNSVVRWIADRAQWLVLLPGVVCYPVLDALHTRLPMALTAVTAASAVAIATEAGDFVTRSALRPRGSR